MQKHAIQHSRGAPRLPAAPAGAARARGPGTGAPRHPRGVAAGAAAEPEARAPAAYTLRPGQVPAASPTSTSLAAGAAPALTLFRDTNAWCPFCERVWLALEHKGIPFEQEYVDLMDKPEWYTDLVPTGLVPAARFHADDKLVWESDTILEEIEERFPDAPALIPADPEERRRMERFIEEQLTGDASVGTAGFRYLIGGEFGQDPDPAKLPEYREQLEAAVARTAAYCADGFIAGGSAMTLADVMVAPSLERLAAQLPALRGYKLREQLAPWFAAMQGVEAYRRVKTDAETHVTVVRKIFATKAGVEVLSTGLPRGPFDEGAAAEAGAKLNMNMDAVVADVIKNSGVDAGQEESVRTHLRVLSEHLLRGDDPLAIRPLAAVPDVPRGETDEAKKLAAAQAKAAGAATLAYMRSRVSSPRDMSAAAATAFRAACEVCLASVY